MPSVTTPPKNRRQFVRTRVTLVERVASVVCLVLLAAIGGYVLWKGKHFDPALYSVRTESLQTTTNEVKGEDGTVRAADARPELEAAVAPKPEAMVASGGAEAAPAPDASASAEGSAEGSASGPPIKGDPLEVNLPGTSPMSEIFVPCLRYWIESISASRRNLGPAARSTRGY